MSLDMLNEKLNILVIILLALSSNLDNIGVSASYGIRKISIPLASNLVIAFITGTGTLLSMLTGRGLYKFLDPNTAPPIGAAIIIAIGVWVLLRETVMRKPVSISDSHQSISKHPVHKKIAAILENPFAADMDFSGHINLKEGMLLGFALTLNNLVNGVGAGMMGLNVSLTTLLVFIFSILTIWIGITLGNYGTHWLGRLAGPAAGFLLIVVGLIELIF